MKARKAWLLGVWAVALSLAGYNFLGSSSEAPANTSSKAPANNWDKVWEYTCRIQEWATGILNSSHPLVVWNQFFTTNPSEISYFEHRQTPYRLPNSFNQTWGLEVYFITNQASLDNGDKADLNHIAEQINNIWGNVTVLLEWYADARWSESANERMATRRIESVEEYIRSRLNSNVQVTFEHASFGETTAQQDTSNLSHDELLELRPDRRVVISISWNTITAWLDRSPADAYVLDASGSMDGRSWDIVSSYDYPDNSTVFSFTDTHLNYDDDDCANTLDDQNVSGQTPLLISVMNVIESWDYDNKTITILSDGWDNVGNMSSSRVIEEAQNRWISINVIWIWNADTALLQNIAESTWWIYTFER